MPLIFRFFCLSSGTAESASEAAATRIQAAHRGKLARRVNKKEQEAAVCIQTVQRNRWLRRPRVHSSAMHAPLHPAIAVSASAAAPAPAVTAAAAVEKGDYRSDQIKGEPCAEASTVGHRLVQLETAFLLFLVEFRNLSREMSAIRVELSNLQEAQPVQVATK